MQGCDEETEENNGGNVLMLKVKFRNLDQIQKFCNIAEKYGNVIVANGSIEVDGESFVGLSTMGLNKILEVRFNDKDKIVQFEQEVAALGITR